MCSPVLEIIQPTIAKPAIGLRTLLNVKKPADLVRRNVMKWQADQKVDEVTDHESRGDVGRFGEPIWCVAKSGPDCVDHRFYSFLVASKSF